MNGPFTHLFWIGIAWLGYVYVGYPLLMALLCLAKRVRPKIDDRFLPTVTVLFAARNEEKDIEWKVRETLAWDYPPDRLQVLVASDASEDRTDALLAAIDDPRLQWLRMPEPGGKNRALNRLVDMARGELLFFTDANSHIEPHCLRRMTRHFADARVGCVTGEMHYLKGGSSIGSGARTYWGYESLIKRLESTVGSVLVCVGSIFCIRRELFAPLRPDVANDLETPMRIGRAGYWLRYEPAARSMERPASSPWEEFARRRRICGRGMRGMWALRGVFGPFRGWQFASRKFLRWLALLPLLLVLVSSAALSNHPAFAVVFGLQTLLYALALAGFALARLGRSGGPALSIPFYFLLVNLAAFLGVAGTLAGRQFVRWDVASTSRGR